VLFIFRVYAIVAVLYALAKSLLNLMQTLMRLGWYMLVSQRIFLREKCY